MTHRHIRTVPSRHAADDSSREVGGGGTAVAVLGLRSASVVGAERPPGRPAPSLPAFLPPFSSSRRAQPPADPVEGVVFPLSGEARSTSAAGRGVVADAVRAVAPDLAQQVLDTRAWRTGYLPHFREMTRLALTAPGGATSIAAAGLASVHERFRYRHDGEDLPLSAVAELADGPGALGTHTVTGRGRPGPDVLSVPYRGGRLVADDLAAQLDVWLAAGTAEPSFADAVRAVMARPGWLDLRDVTVVVLGAGAQMGPLVSLLGWGAHVVAVDLPRPAIWSRLLGVAHGTPGRLSLPLHRPLPADATDDEIAHAAGVDLVARAPQVAAWLAGLEGPYTLGSYVYADGAAHTRASVAVDAMTTTLLARARGRLAGLPRDAHGRLRRSARGGHGQPAPVRGPPVPAPAGTGWARPGAVPAQPHRARAPARRLGGGRRTTRSCRSRGRTTPWRSGSSGGGPCRRGPTAGWSPERGAADADPLGAAQPRPCRGLCRCAPVQVEVFDPSTSNTLMAALLVHDLRNPAAAANPATPLRHRSSSSGRGRPRGLCGRLRAPLRAAGARRRARDAAARGVRVDDAALRRILEAARWAPAPTTASPGAPASPAAAKRRLDALFAALMPATRPGGTCLGRSCSWPPPTPTARAARCGGPLRRRPGRRPPHRAGPRPRAWSCTDGRVRPDAAAPRVPTCRSGRAARRARRGNHDPPPTSRLRSRQRSAPPGARGRRRAAPGAGTAAAAQRLTSRRRAPEADVCPGRSCGTRPASGAASGGCSVPPAPGPPRRTASARRSGRTGLST